MRDGFSYQGDLMREPWSVSGLHVQGYEGAAEGERRSVAASTRSPKLQQRARRSRPIGQIAGELGVQKFRRIDGQPAFQGEAVSRAAEIFVSGKCSPRAQRACARDNRRELCAI